MWRLVPGSKASVYYSLTATPPHAEGLVVHLGPIAAGVPRVILGRVESDRSQRMGSVKLFWQGLAGKEAAIAPIEWVDEMDEVAARQLRREMGLLHMITAEEHYWRWQERDPARARGYLAKAREWLQTLASENLLPADLLNLHRALVRHQRSTRDWGGDVRPVRHQPAASGPSQHRESIASIKVTGVIGRSESTPSVAGRDLSGLISDSRDSHPEVARVNDASPVAAPAGPGAGLGLPTTEACTTADAAIRRAIQVAMNGSLDNVCILVLPS